MTPSVCGKTLDYGTTDNGSASVHAELMQTIAASRAMLGRSRGVIDARYPVGTEQSMSVYQNDDDYMNIAPNATYGADARFYLAHEYGHAVHEKALDGNRGAGGGGCNPHYFTGPEGASNHTCAFSEGFADFHAALTRGTSIGPYWYNHMQTPETYPSGAIAEQTVAAFLLDVTDPAYDEPHDLVYYPASYVADLIRTCEDYPTLSGFTYGYARPNGIDGILWCMEQQVDVSAANVYFPYRSPQYTAFRESAFEPGGPTQQADVRRFWLWDLFHQ